MLISPHRHYLCTSHTKWLCYISSHFAKSVFFFFFCMTPLHAHAQYICIVYAKYQKASVKALVQVDFPVYALSKHNPNLKANRKNSNRKKWLNSQNCHFVKNKIFWHQTSSCKCSKCLYCVGISDCLAKAVCGTS